MTKAEFSRLRRRGLAVIVAVPLAACGAKNATSTIDSAPQPVKTAASTVIETTTIRLQGKAFVASPDGKRAAVLDGDKVCVTGIGTGGPLLCGDATRRAEVLSVRWSPDSTRLVFTERFVSIGQDPGAFIIEADSGKQTALTDDNPAGTGDAVPNAVVDLFPSFTPEGASIVFWRLDLATDTANVMTVAATGGSPSRLSTDVSISAQSVAGPITTTATSMLFSVLATTASGNTAAGIYQAKRDGRGLTRVAPVTSNDGPLEVRSVSMALDQAIIADTDQLTGRRLFENPFSTLDLTTGERTPIPASSGAVLGATFSPRGDQTVIVRGAVPASAATDAGLELVIRDGVSGADRKLADIAFARLNDAGGHSVMWLQNDTVLVSNTFVSSIAFRLG